MISFSSVIIYYFKGVKEKKKNYFKWYGSLEAKTQKKKKTSMKIHKMVKTIKN
jgi:late competence protein required for DNA uptake (superfamily II DNA/RNA helicase)